MANKDDLSTSRHRVFAQPSEVPDDLVGREYSTLSDIDRKKVRAYRESKKLCFACGRDGHEAWRCERTRKPTVFTSITANGNKEYRQNVGKVDRVPPHLVGRLYRSMDTEDRLDVLTWRNNNEKCASCGDDEHRYWQCKQYNIQFTQEMERKNADIKAGYLVPLTMLTGPFGRLPSEIKLQICIEALREDAPVKVLRAKTLPALAFIPGLSKEALEAFFSVNTFSIFRKEHAKGFQRMVKALNVSDRITSICLETLSYEYTLGPRKQATAEPALTIDLMRLCPNLTTLSITFKAAQICHDIESLGQRFRVIKVLGLLDLCELQNLFLLPALRIVSIGILKSSKATSPRERATLKLLENGLVFCFEYISGKHGKTFEVDWHECHWDEVAGRYARAT